ncbi:MAG: enolase C-terminal domain-like protein [Actinoallomurus sp.]
MKITDVTAELVGLAAEEPAFRWRDGLPGSEPAATGVVVRVVTDEGITGEARSRRGEIVRDLVARVIRPELLGHDPLDRELLWQRMWDLDRREAFPVYVVGLIDIALWDLAGKIAGLPVYHLAGGFRTSIPAYASTVTYGSIAEYLDVADQCRSAGFTAIKIHAWGDARRDIALIEALREHMGDAVPLMYDGSAGFDLPDAITVGRALSECGYLWYEEPMPESSVSAYRQLAAKVDVALLVGETSSGAHNNIGDFVAVGCAPFVRTSAYYKGGITGALRIAHLADAYHLRAEVHGMGVVSEHLCMAISNNTYYESRISGNPIAVETVVDASGHVHARTAPGLGYDLPSLAAAG